MGRSSWVYPVYVRTTLLDIASGGGSIVVGGALPDNTPVAGRGWSVEAGEPGELVVVVQDEPHLLATISPGASFSVTVANVHTYQAVQCRGYVVSAEPMGSADTARAMKRSKVFVEQVARAHLDNPEVIASMVPQKLIAVRLAEQEFFDQAPRPRLEV